MSYFISKVRQFRLLFKCCFPILSTFGALLLLLYSISCRWNGKTCNKHKFFARLKKYIWSNHLVWLNKTNLRYDVIRKAIKYLQFAAHFSNLHCHSCTRFLEGTKTQWYCRKKKFVYAKWKINSTDVCNYEGCMIPRPCNIMNVKLLRCFALNSPR